jgi:uncharacterized membrane protein YbhN (UPF0104 family)
MDDSFSPSSGPKVDAAPDKFSGEGKKRKTGLLRLVGTLLALALLIYLLGQQGWSEILTAVQKISPWQFALAMGLALISRLVVSGRWYVLLRSAGIRLSYWQSVRITLAGHFASNFLPTTIGGDVVRLAGAMRLQYDAAICAASLIVDRLVGMAGMVMVLPFGLPSLFKGQAAMLPLIGKLVRRVLDALGMWLHQPRALLASLAFSWLHQLCLFSIIYVLFVGMGETQPFWLVAGLYSLVYFVTLIPISINGYGLQEISMTFVFSSLAGASVSAGLTAALLFRTLMMLASVPGVLFVPGLIAVQRAPAEKAAPTDRAAP